MELKEPKTFHRPAAKHRSSIQILAEILIISSGDEASQSEIIAKAKLNYRQIKSYLDWLLEIGLLETTVRQNNYCGYRTTLKGYHLLATLGNVQQLLNNPQYLNIQPL